MTKETLSASFKLALIEGNSDKFYYAEIKGRHVNIVYGRSTTTGNNVEKNFRTPEEAAKEFFKIGRDKMRKGYRIEEAQIQAATTTSVRYFLRRPVVAYGSVQRERATMTLAKGAELVKTLLNPEPDEQTLYDTMFLDGDLEFLSALSKSHPAVSESELAGLGAWLTTS